MSIDSTLKTLRRELRDLDKQRARLQSAIDALEPLATNGNGTAPSKRQAKGSPLIESAIATLRAATKPLPIMDLVTAMQKNGFQPGHDPKKVRASVVSALLRRTDVFTKPERAIYGLVEWEDHDGTK